MLTKICLICKNEFHTYPAVNSKYCSLKCRNISYKGKHCSPQTEFKKGQKGANWKGGKHKDHHGYWYIWKPTHHRALKKGYVKPCILIAEQKLSRPLINTEIVHHIDGRKDNDSPSNLVVISDTQHRREHTVDNVHKRWL